MRWGIRWNCTQSIWWKIMRWHNWRGIGWNARTIGWNKGSTMRWHIWWNSWRHHRRNIWWCHTRIQCCALCRRSRKQGWPKGRQDSGRLRLQRRDGEYLRGCHQLILEENLLSIFHKKCLGPLAGVSHNAGGTRGSSDVGIQSRRTGSARGSANMVLMDAGRAVEVGILQGAITVRSHGVGIPVVGCHWRRDWSSPVQIERYWSIPV